MRVVTAWMMCDLVGPRETLPPQVSARGRIVAAPRWERARTLVRAERNMVEVDLVRLLGKAWL